jgi:hypothetical protein
MNGPTKLARAVNPRATRGDKARDEIMVATTLLESCIPLRKSNPNAKIMTRIVAEDIPLPLLT